MAEAIACSTAMHSYAQLCTAGSWHAVLMCSLYLPPFAMAAISNSNVKDCHRNALHMSGVSIASKKSPKSFHDPKKNFLNFVISFLKARTNIAQTFQLSGVGNVEGGLFNKASWPQTCNVRVLFRQTLLKLSHFCVVTFHGVTFHNLIFEFPAWFHRPFLMPSCMDHFSEPWALLRWISVRPHAFLQQVFGISTYLPEWVNFGMWFDHFFVPVWVCCKFFFPFFSHRISQANSDHCHLRKPSSTQLGSLLRQLSCSNPSWVWMEMNRR